MWIRFGPSRLDGRWSFKRWRNATTWGVRLGFVAFGGSCGAE